MTLPPRHDWYCLYLGWSSSCPVCHPPALCKSCGHSILAHFYTPEPIKDSWCPRCRGCDSPPEGEALPVTLPQPPRRSRTDGQTLSPCKGFDTCGNRVGEGEDECSVCRNVDRNWSTNTPLNQHPRETR